MNERYMRFAYEQGELEGIKEFVKHKIKLTWKRSIKLLQILAISSYTSESHFRFLYLGLW